MVDSISAAIVAAVSAGAATGVTDVAKKAIADAYDGLKELIKKKFGGESKVAAAIKELDADPEADGRRITVAEEIGKVKAADDPEIVAAASALTKLIKSLPEGEKYSQFVRGNFNALAHGDGASAEVHVYGTPKE